MRAALPPLVLGAAALVLLVDVGVVASGAATASTGRGGVRPAAAIDADLLGRAMSSADLRALLVPPDSRFVPATAYTDTQRARLTSALANTPGVGLAAVQVYDRPGATVVLRVARTTAPWTAAQRQALVDADDPETTTVVGDDAVTAVVRSTSVAAVVSSDRFVVAVTEVDGGSPDEALVLAREELAALGG